MLLRYTQYGSFLLGSLLLCWFALDSGADELERRQLMAVILENEPDTLLWSASRQRAYRQGQTAIGAIIIPDSEIEAPIVAGTSDEALNRGVGWLRSSTSPGGDGNVVLAAHRDGYFRGLKDLDEGSEIAIVTAQGRDRYRVSAIQIVNPEDTWVLENTNYPSLTLVTCYPFYHVGSAPQRFVVYADRLKPKISTGAETP